MKTSFSRIQKMTMAAMLIALAGVFTILSKVISIPGLRALSPNLAPVITMFGSMTLGPFYGIFIGVAGDLIGLLYPTGAYNFFYTLIAGLYGLLPWLISLLNRLIRKKVPFSYILYGALALIFVLLVVGMYATGMFDYYFERDLGEGAGNWLKPVLLSVVFVLEVGLAVGLYFSNRYFERQGENKGDYPSPWECAFIALIVEILLGVFAKAGALSYYYGVLANSSSFAYATYPYLLLYLCLAAPFAIFINSFVLSWLTIFYWRYAATKGKIIEPEKESVPEIDYSLLTEEEKEQVKTPIPWGWIIFFGVIVILIVVCVIVISTLGSASDPNGYDSSSAATLFLHLWK